MMFGQSMWATTWRTKADWPACHCQMTTVFGPVPVLSVPQTEKYLPVYERKDLSSLSDNEDAKQSESPQKRMKNPEMSLQI